MHRMRLKALLAKFLLCSCKGGLRFKRINQGTHLGQALLKNQPFLAELKLQLSNSVFTHKYADNKGSVSSPRFRELSTWSLHGCMCPTTNESDRLLLWDSFITFTVGSFGWLLMGIYQQDLTQEPQDLPCFPSYTFP